MEPTHSPFGLVGQIARDTGWSVSYIMRGVNYPTLIMMWNDVPHYVDGKKTSILDMFRQMEKEGGKAKPTPEKRKGLPPLDYFTQIKEDGAD
jgi:hypothetical protein